jgi:hypothetical protein
MFPAPAGVEEVKRIWMEVTWPVTVGRHDAI